MQVITIEQALRLVALKPELDARYRRLLALLKVEPAAATDELDIDILAVELAINDLESATRVMFPQQAATDDEVY